MAEKPINYVLEAYLPDGNKPALVIETLAPFASIAKGDTLFIDADTPITVDKIEHLPFENEHRIVHKIMINR